MQLYQSICRNRFHADFRDMSAYRQGIRGGKFATVIFEDDSAKGFLCETFTDMIKIV